MEDIENCFKCGQTPDDILMLTCNHDLCLLCAAQSFSYQSKQYSNKKNLTCEICQATTELDGSSINELQEIYQSMNEEQKKSQQIDHSPVNLLKSNQSKKKDQGNHKKNTLSKNLGSIDSITSTFQISNIVVADKENVLKGEYQSRYSASHRNMQNSTIEVNVKGGSKDFCPEHPDEDLYYFCFTCLCQCVCPECVIHGIHRDHDVKTIKKSYPLVKSQLENTIDQNLQVMHQIQGNKDEIEKRNSQQNLLINKFRYQIQQEFDVLHKVLSLQEKSLLESINSIPSVQERYENYTQHCRLIEQHLKSLNSTIQKQFQAKEESKLLNFYSEFTKIQVPKLEQLPLYNEPQTNQQDILEGLNQVRKGVENIEFKTYTTTKTNRLTEEDSYHNQTQKLLDKKLY